MTFHVKQSAIGYKVKVRSHIKAEFSSAVECGRQFNCKKSQKFVSLEVQHGLFEISPVRLFWMSFNRLFKFRICQALLASLEYRRIHVSCFLSLDFTEIWQLAVDSFLSRKLEKADLGKP